MDILFHALTGIIISKTTTGTISLPTIVSALLPDILGGLPYQFLKMKYASINTLEDFISTIAAATRNDHFYGDWDRILYRTSHSWLSLIFVGITYYCIFSTIWFPMLVSYFSHLIIDLPTHQGDFAQRPLYPFSDWSIKGIGWTNSKKLFMRMWIGLLVITIVALSTS